MLLLPAAIDMLNRRNIIAIQQIEAAAPHLRTLQLLCEQLNGELRDVKPIANNRFAFEIGVPEFWAAHPVELSRLLLDFDHRGDSVVPTTGQMFCWSTSGHQLIMTPISRDGRAAA